MIKVIYNPHNGPAWADFILEFKAIEFVDKFINQGLTEITIGQTELVSLIVDEWKQTDKRLSPLSVWQNGELIGVHN